MFFLDNLLVMGHRVTSWRVRPDEQKKMSQPLIVIFFFFVVF